MADVKDKLKNINETKPRKVTQGHLKSEAEKNTDMIIKLIKVISD